MAGFLEPSDVDGFSPLACRERWLALQRLRADAGVDAVLLVLGPDAQFSRGSEVAFNWLLGGLGGRPLLNAPLDPRYDECVVCLRANGSTVFCRQAVLEEVASRTSMWECCEVIAPTSAEEADTDSYDLRKIGAFIGMMSGCGSLGVAMQQRDAPDDVKMTLERWPLVQAFAYDEYGQGFLTMSRPVSNIEMLLQRRLYSGWDLHAVAWARGVAPQLRRAWDEALMVHDRRSPAVEGPVDLVAAATEPLLDYFEYGRLALSDDDVRELRGQPPEGGDPPPWEPTARLLIGPAQTSSLQGGTAAGIAGLASQADPEALHCIWEGVDPSTGVAATRTYALRGLWTARGVQQAGLGAVLRAYAAAAACCRHLLGPEGPQLQALARLDAEQRSAQLRSEAAAFLGRALPELAGALPAPEVSYAEVDAAGMTGAVPPGSSAVMLFVRVLFGGLTCPETGASLGAVAYGDSVFLARASPAGTPAATATLTAGLPTLAFWLAAAESAHSTEVRGALEGLLAADQGTFVALGHRPDLRVPLEPPKPPPDPLGLGAALDEAFRCSLAAGGGCRGSPLVALAHGTAWAFDSGKVVFSSVRTGYTVLQVPLGDPGMAAAEAPGGLVWVPASPCGAACAGDLRVALTANPLTVARWRQTSNPRDDSLAAGDDLLWIHAGGSSSSNSSPHSELLCEVALAGAAAPAAAAAQLGGTARRCVWVSGLPACGAADMAASLALALDARLVCIGPGACRGGPCPSASSVVVDAARQALEAAAAGHEAVVVCDMCSPPAEVLVELEGHAEFAASFSLLHVVSVVEPSIAYPWTSARHPLLLSRTSRGWVNAVVVQDLMLAGGRAAAAVSSRLLRELRAGRAGAHVLHRPTAMALAEGPLLEAIPGPWRALAPAASREARLHCAFVPFGFPLDTGRLVSCLAARLAQAARLAAPTPGAAADAGSPWEGLFCVEARVHGAAAAELWSLETDELYGVLSQGLPLRPRALVLAPGGELQVPKSWTAPLAEQEGVLWWWCLRGAAQAEAASLQAAAEAAVAECRLPPPPPLPRLGEDDLSPQEVAVIEAEAMASELPPGFYFDGTTYIDVDGRAQREHPMRAQRLGEFLAHRNAEVDVRNSLLAQVAALPVFAGASP